VLAIEIDPALSSTLLRSARSWPNVFVHQGDALDTQIPGTSFRVVGNIPFEITTALLRRITRLDQVERLDLITQLEPARKRRPPEEVCSPCSGAPSGASPFAGGSRRDRSTRHLPSTPLGSSESVARSQ
jgi:Ribosomal RNA adenine dimethylase